MRAYRWVCRVLHHAAIVFSVVYAAVVLVLAAIFQPDLTLAISALVIPLIVAGLIADSQERKLRAIDEKLDRLLEQKAGTTARGLEPPSSASLD